MGTIKISSAASTAATDEDLDPSLTAVQEWAKISGKRAKKTREFVTALGAGPVCMGFRLVCLSLVDEAIRFLTFEFLSCGNRVTTHSVPTLLGFANLRRSPLVAACQYLTSLLCETQGRVRLVCKHLSVHEWERQQQQEVRVFRRLVLLAIGWVQRRHSDCFEGVQGIPFSLCLLADSEASTVAKAEIVSAWDGLMPCCVRAGMARTLKKRGVTGSDLMSSKKCLSSLYLLVFTLLL